MLVNVALTVLKFVAGFFGHSQALLADAMHSLSDGITDLAVIIGSFFWGRPPDEHHPHGHQRIETLITIMIGLLIFAAGISMSWHAIITIRGNNSATPNWIALVMVFVSMVSKEALCRWTIKYGKKYYSSAVIANACEQRSDAIGSVPAFFSILGAIIFPTWNFLDSVGAIIVSIFIINTALKILIPRMQELLESGAPKETLTKIASIVHNNEQVHDAHKIRTRYLGANLLLDFHLVVAANITVKEGHDIAEAVKKQLFHDLPDLIDVVVHIEPDDMVCGTTHLDD